MEQTELIMPTPGPLFKKKRQELGWDLKDVADELLLSTTQLEAIERDDFDSLPGATYVIGYWRNYSNLLGIDVTREVDAYKDKLKSPSTTIVLEPNHQRAHGQVERSRKKSAMVFFVLSALFLGSIWYWQNPDSNPFSQWMSNQSTKALSLRNSGESEEAVVNDESSSITEPTEDSTILPEPNFSEEFDENGNIIQSDSATVSLFQNDDADIQDLSDSNQIIELDVAKIELPLVEVKSSVESDVDLHTNDDFEGEIQRSFENQQQQTGNEQSRTTEVSVSSDTENVVSEVGSESGSNNELAEPEQLESEQVETSAVETSTIEPEPVAASTTESEQVETAAAEVESSEQAELTANLPKVEQEQESVELPKTQEESQVSQSAEISSVSNPEMDATSIDKLIINIGKETWLDVRDQSGSKLIYRIASIGETVVVTGDPPFSVFLGTADSADVRYLGKQVEYEPHKSGLFARFVVGEQ